MRLFSGRIASVTAMLASHFANIGTVATSTEAEHPQTSNVPWVYKPRVWERATPRKVSNPPTYFFGIEAMKAYCHEVAKCRSNGLYS